MADIFSTDTGTDEISKKSNSTLSNSCIELDPSIKDLDEYSNSGLDYNCHPAEYKGISSFTGTNDSILCLDFNDYTKELAVGGCDELLRIYKIENSDMKPEMDFSSVVTLNPAEKLNRKSHKYKICFYNQPAQEVNPKHNIYCHKDSIVDLAYSPNYLLLATASYDSVVRVFEVENNYNILLELEGALNEVEWVIWNKESDQLCVGTTIINSPIYMYSIPEGTLLWCFSQDNKAGFIKSIILADNTIFNISILGLLSQWKNNTLEKKWDTSVIFVNKTSSKNRTKCSYTAQSESEQITICDLGCSIAISSAISSGSEYIAIGYSCGTVSIVNVKNDFIWHKQNLHEQTTESMAFQEKSNLLATTSMDGQIFIIDVLNSYKIISINTQDKYHESDDITEEKSEFNTLEWHPNIYLYLLMTLSLSGNLYFWDIKYLKCIIKIDLHLSTILALKLHNENNNLVIFTGSEDQVALESLFTFEYIDKNNNLVTV